MYQDIGAILSGIAAIVTATIAVLNFRQLAHSSSGDQPSGSDSTTSGSRNHTVVIFAVLSVLAVILLVYFMVSRTQAFGGQGGPSSSSTPTGPITASPTTSPTPVPIKISAIGPTVPECVTFSGTGDVPDDQLLWLVVRSSEPKYYFFPTQPDMTTHTWTARVQIGADQDPPGTPFVVYADLFTDATSRLINSHDYSNGVDTLPDGITVKDQVHLQRGSDNHPC